MTTLDPRGLEAALHAVEGEGLTSDGGTPHGWRCEHPDRYPDYCKCPIDVAKAAVTAYLAVAQPIVTTVEELVELPVGTAVLCAKDYPLWLNRRTVQGWWYRPGDEEDFSDDEIPLPARVIHRSKEQP